MKIGVASDHAGYRYKEAIKDLLASLGHEVRDFGTDSEAPVDYPAVIRPLAEAVGRGELERGVAVGGSGNGEAMVANRVPGVRCAVCWNDESARLARQHNDANMLALGQRMMPRETALSLVRIWLETPLEGDRHLRRIQMIDAPPADVAIRFPTPVASDLAEAFAGLVFPVTKAQLVSFAAERAAPGSEVLRAVHALPDRIYRDAADVGTAVAESQDFGTA